MPREQRWLRLAPPPAVPAPISVPPPPNDDDLIAAVVRGDRRFAAQIHDRLIGPIERTLYRIFGRRERDHDDMIQTAFEQVVVTLKNKRFVGACSLPTWASSVAAHVAFRALRSRKQERRIFERDSARSPPDRPSGIDLEGQLDAQRQIELCRAELVGMEPNKAMTLFMHDVLGYELAEIAVLTNASVAAAQSRLVRGRRDLHKRLEKRGLLSTEDDRGR